MYNPYYYLLANVCSVQTVEEANKHGSESSSAVEWGFRSLCFLQAITPSLLGVFYLILSSFAWRLLVSNSVPFRNNIQNLCI